MKRATTTLADDRQLKLGLFGANCSAGITMTMVPERWDASWEHNLALARLADARGLDFLLPIARWRGYGGLTDPNGYSLETLAWAAGLLAATRRITVFATVHAPLVHPVFAAKQLATIDHIGRGRLGLNIVCGWNPEEFAMFGGSHRAQADRYAHGREWYEIIRRLWAESEPFDYHGRYFDLQGAVCTPKPYAGSELITMNAGRSEAGRQFAVETVDCLFTGIENLDTADQVVADVRRRAAAVGRPIDVYSVAYVVCRPTQKEAEDYLHYYAVEHRDEASLEKFRTINPSEGDTNARLARWAAGHGGFPAVGDPDRVAEILARVHRAGYAGLALGFVNYLDELPYFCDEVMPRLERLGVRRSTTGADGEGDGGTHAMARY
ncbi:MAG: LLM class flavin-dependent oxidoreductase [Firmicutes bacterium]|nr:LLM class flavin-dependent oxidoreductase [Bacillota bacterium]